MGIWAKPMPGGCEQKVKPHNFNKYCSITWNNSIKNYWYLSNHIKFWAPNDYARGNFLCGYGFVYGFVLRKDTLQECGIGNAECGNNEGLFSDLYRDKKGTGWKANKVY